jgi:ParB-like chromosome segregation protein Spo0J
MSAAKVGFEMRKRELKLDDILPLRQVKPADKAKHRYRAILASIQEVGLVEPLMVHPHKHERGKYVLLDGHQRYAALRELNRTSGECIVATDDEGYTYNARVNRLPAVQEHKMIVKAVQNGVKPERIAAALRIPVHIVRASMRLLDGINEEAAELLKARNISGKSVRLLKRVSGVRQIEIVELMISTNNFSAGYAEALILATPKDQLMAAAAPRKVPGMTAEEMARMEEEMVTLERGLKAVEDAYGENVLNLTLARGYIKKLLENTRVVKFLKANHGDILSEFEGIVAADAI